MEMWLEMNKCHAVCYMFGPLIKNKHDRQQDFLSQAESVHHVRNLLLFYIHKNIKK